MKYAAIAPIRHLEETKGNAIHMALAHLAVNREYCKFMEQEQMDGKFIMMDNSLIELGYAMPYDELLEAAEKLYADEIVIPDSFKNANETVKLAKEYVPKLQERGGYRIAAVAHGRTLEEWLWCAKQLIALGIDTLGIPKVMCATLDVYGREVCLRGLKRMLQNGEIEYMPTIHLFGIWEDPLEVASIAKKIALGSLPQVRSVDSVIAYQMASFGLAFGDAPRPLNTPVDFFEGYTPENSALIRANISNVRTLAYLDHCTEFIQTDITFDHTLITERTKEKLGLKLVQFDSIRPRRR